MKYKTYPTLFFLATLLAFSASCFQRGSNGPDKSGDPSHTVRSIRGLNPASCCTLAGNASDTGIARLILDHVPAWLDTGNFEVDLQLAELACEITGQYLPAVHPLPAEAWAYRGQVHLELHQEEPDLMPTAIDYLKKALDIRKALGDTLSLAAAEIYFFIGTADFISGDPQTAIDHLNKALVIKEAAGLHNLIFAQTEEHIGRVLMALEKYEAALPHLHRSNEAKRDSLPNDHLMLAFATGNLGVTYRMLQKEPEAMHYLQLSRDILAKDIDSHYESLIMVLGQMGASYLNQGDWEQAVVHQEQALKLHQQQIGKRDYQLASIHYDFGNLYMQTGNIHRSLEHFTEGLTIALANLEENDPTLSYYYSAAAEAYRSVGEYELAENLLKKGLNLRRAYHGAESLPIAASYHGLGRVYQDTEQFDQALPMLREALRIRLANYPSGHGDVVNTYSRLGNTYADAGQYERAVEHLEKMLVMQQQLNHPDTARAIVELGYAYFKWEKYGPAEAYLQRGLRAARIVYGERHSIVSNTYTQLAMLSLGLDEPDRALSYIDSALISLQFTTLENLPEVISLQHLLFALNTKSQIFIKQHQNTKDTELLRRAADAFNQALSVLEYYQKSYEDPRSQLNLVSENFGIFEDAMRTNFRLDPKNEDSFRISEQSKSVQLRQAFYNSHAKTVAGVPEQLTEQENQLKIQIASTENKLAIEEARNGTKQDTLITALQNQLVDQREAHRRLIDQMEADYPDYYQLKYNTEVVSVADVQENILEPNQALIEYYVGDSSVFAFVILPDRYDMVEIRKDFPLAERVKKMRSGMDRPLVPEAEKDSVYAALDQQYVEASVELYRRLFTPLVPFLEGIGELIIVPAGPLANLPFEALLTKPPSKAQHYKTHDYLIRDYSIGYSYSATLLYETRTRKRRLPKRKRFLALAPDYQGYGATGDTSTLANLGINVSNRNNWLPQLLRNPEKVAGIARLMQGELEPIPTKTNFLRKAPDYQMVHLSMHGKANERRGENSFLAFPTYSDSLPYDLLYVRDLYNLRLPADLVVLSACETGIGELRRGEGVISLARGFTYAGAQSLVTSLWSVNDQSTYELMDYFYEHLESEPNITKAEALQRAKMDMIRKSIYPQPFAWAGFIGIGDMDQLQRDSTGSFYWMGGLALLVLFGFVVYRRLSSRQL